MNNKFFSIPYPIGTYLIKNENGVQHLDQVNRYILDEKGLSVILTLDALKEPRLSTEISVDRLLENWKEAQNIFLTGNNIGTKILTGMEVDKGPILSLKGKSK